MAVAASKRRADSLTSTLSKPSGSESRRPRTETPRCSGYSVLRSAPIDSSFSSDIFQWIQRSWCSEIACCPDTPTTNRTLSSPPSPLPSHRRYPLSHYRASPDALYSSLTSQPVSPQPTSLLFSKLPPEIRLQIFTHLLTSHAGPIHCVTGGGLPPPPRYALSPAILRTCRRAALEGLPVLYGRRNRFRLVHVPNAARSRAGAPRVVLWPRCFALVRRLAVDVPDKRGPRFLAADWSAAPDGLECRAELAGALVALAARGAGLAELRLNLVRNCIVESYTSWGPHVAPDTPLMEAVEADFLPRVLGPRGAEAAKACRATFSLVVPCGDGGEAGEPQKAFDVLRWDAPVVVHAVARRLGALQKTASLNGLSLEDSLRVVVVQRKQEGEEAVSEILVDGEDTAGQRSSCVTLQVSC